MKKTIAILIMLIFTVSLLAACQPVQPEVQDIEKPEAVTPEEPAVEAEEPEEEPVEEQPAEITAEALYDGVYVVCGKAARGDVFSVTGVNESAGWYNTDLDGVPVFIDTKYLRLDSQAPASAWEGKTASDLTVYPTAYLEGEGTIIPAGTAVTVADEFSGLYYIVFRDADGNEIKGYAGSGSDIKSAAEEEKEETSSDKEKSADKDKDKDKDKESDKKKDDGKKEDEKEDPKPKPKPDPKPDPEPDPKDKESDSSEDGDDIELAARPADDYGIVLLAGVYETAEAGEDASPAEPRGDEEVDAPAGLAGYDDGNSSDDFTAQNGTVFSDGTELYLGVTVRGEEYVLTDPEAALAAAPEDDVSIMFAGSTGTVPRWALKLDGDTDYEQWPAKALKDIYPLENGLGRGKGVEIAEGTLLTVIGDTGAYLVMLTEDGRTLYLASEGSDEAVMKYDEAAIEAEKKAQEQEEEKAREEAKEEKKKESAKDDSSSESKDKSKKDEDKSKDDKKEDSGKKDDKKEDDSSGGGSDNTETKDDDDSGEFTPPIL